MLKGDRSYTRAAAFYTVLVRLAGGRLYRAHGEEMVQAFRSSLRDAHEAAGVRGYVKTWLVSIGDLARTAFGVRRDQRLKRRARRAARRRGVESALPRASAEVLSDLGADVRFAARALLRTPVFTLSALLILGGGLGLVTGVFQVLDEVLLRPLPFDHPEELVVLTTESMEPRITRGQISQEVAWALQESAGPVEDVATVDFGVFSIGTDEGGPAEAVRGMSVSANLFEVLGVSMLLGRSFAPEEGEPGASDVVMLGHGFWTRRYGADDKVLGRLINVDGRARTVIGVLPPDFEDPFGGGVQESAAVYAPLALERGSPLARSRWLLGVGRLASGVDAAEAASPLRATYSRLADRDPDTFPREMSIGVYDLTDATRRETAAALRLALGATLLVLLVICANLSALYLSRVAARSADVSVRRALGGSRFRVVRQALTESLLLSAAGSLLAVGVAQAFTAAVERIAGGSAPRLAAIGFDGRTFFFLVTATVASALAVGLIPALRVSGADPQRSLRERASLGGGRRRLDSLMVVTQTTAAVALAVGAGLLYQSFARLGSVDAGFEAQGVLTFQLQLPSSRYAAHEEIALFHRQLHDRLAALPSVHAVGAVNKRPLGSRWGCRGVLPGGRAIPERESDWPCFESMVATPGYFAAMGIVFRRGGAFAGNLTPEDEPVAIVSGRVAEELWPGRPAVGERLSWPEQVFAEEPGMRVVGVVNDIRHIRLHQDENPAIYQPIGQAADRRMTYAIRSSADPESLVSGIRDAVGELDSDLPLRDLTTMDAVVDGARRPHLVASGFLGLLSAAGLLLSIAGTYAVIAGRVRRRTAEIGLRLALGAEAPSLIRAVIGQGLRLAAIATLLGILFAVGSTRLWSEFLFGVEPTHLPTLLAVGALTLVTAALACYAPAVRAARVHPVEALRES